MFEWVPRVYSNPIFSTVSMGSARVNSLYSKKGKNIGDSTIKRSKELYGYTPEEKSDENMEWMLQHGYVTLKKYKYGPRRRRQKSEFT